MKLKNLTEEFIKQFAGKVIYNRGYDYYEGGMVYELEYDPQQDSIYAEVYGNYGDYEVEISTDNSEIYADCTCPYDGYPCKHIVAVLLTFIHNQKKYSSQASKRKKEQNVLENKVKELSRDELAEIVLSCAKKYPEFRRELMVRLEADPETTLNTILKQIDKAFPSIESRSYNPSDIVKGLKKILISVANAPETMRVKVYWKMLDRILNELNEYGMDDELLEDCAVKVMGLLIELFAEHEQLSEERTAILGKLMDCFIWDNCGIMDDIYETVIELCYEESDYRIVIKKLESQLKKTSEKSYYKDLLADLYGEINDTGSQLKTLESNLRYGMDYWQLAQYWIEKGDKDKTLQVVKEGLEKGEGRRTELYSFMQHYYKEHNDYDRIFQLLETKIKKNDLDFLGRLKHDSIYNCLWEHYRKARRNRVPCLHRHNYSL